MIFSLVLLTCALVGMILMILIKNHEIKTGKEFIFAYWRMKIDHYAHTSFSKLKSFVLTKEHQAVVFLKSIPVKALNSISHFNDYIHKRYGKHIDMVKGRSIPKNKGSVSLFVSAISDYKNEIKKES